MTPEEKLFLEHERDVYWQRGWLAGFFRAASAVEGEEILLPERTSVSKPKGL